MAHGVADDDRLDWSTGVVFAARELRAESRTLRQRAGELRGVSHALQVRFRREIQGASDLDPEHLPAVVRAKLAAGRLPRERGQQMWAGPGSDQACDACDRPITGGQRAYEFDQPGWRTIRFHHPCLEVWHVERLKLDARSPIRGGSDTDLETSAVRIAALLRTVFPSGICVECLATSLERPVKDVRDATQVLVVRPGFRVIERACDTCGRTQATVALVKTPLAPPEKSLG
jgi:hypothetical protein